MTERECCREVGGGGGGGGRADLIAVAFGGKVQHGGKVQNGGGHLCTGSAIPDCTAVDDEVTADGRRFGTAAAMSKSGGTCSTTMG